MASEVQICNLGLMKYGDVKIDTLNDASAQGRFCKVFYPLLRDRLIEAHPWNFACRRADISAQLATTPAFEWAYAYTIPENCLRVREIYNSTEQWVVEGRELLTNQATDIWIKYIARITETGYYTATFVDCLATLIAAEAAAKLSSDKKMRQALLEELIRVKLPEAYSLNAMEGNGPLTEAEKDLSASTAFSWAD